MSVKYTHFEQNNLAIITILFISMQARAVFCSITLKLYHNNIQWYF